jgi:hypothetical protein
MVFHAGTQFKGGQVLANGGRVLGVTALGDTFEGALNNAYGAIANLQFDGHLLPQRHWLPSPPVPLDPPQAAARLRNIKGCGHGVRAVMPQWG